MYERTYDAIKARHVFECRTSVDLDPAEPDRDVMELPRLHGRVPVRPIVPGHLTAHWEWRPESKSWHLTTVSVQGKLRLVSGVIGLKYGTRIFGLRSYEADAPPWVKQYVEEMRREVEKVTP